MEDYLQGMIMPTNSTLFEKANEELAKAEQLARENRKRKRDERDQDRTKVENETLKERLAAASARIQALEDRPAQPVGEDIRNQLAEQAADITRLTTDKERQAAEIERLTQENRNLQQQLVQAQARPALGQGRAAPLLGQAVAGAANPRRVDPGYTDKTRYMNVKPDGTLELRQHWSRQEKALDREIDRQERHPFFKLGGKQSASGMHLVIPAGVDQRRFAATNPPFINPESVISRTPSPVQGEELKFPDKIFYYVQFQDKLDPLTMRDNSGVKIARLVKRDDAEAQEHAQLFEKEKALVCCDNPAVDRRNLLRFQAFDPNTGMIMSPEETLHLHQDLSRQARERSRGRGAQGRG
jgi:hypothetical protein